MLGREGFFPGFFMAGGIRNELNDDVDFLSDKAEIRWRLEGWAYLYRISNEALCQLNRYQKQARYLIGG